MNTQNLRRKYGKLKRAKVYFSVLSALNDLKLTGKEVEFLAWLALHGEPHDESVQASFIEEFQSTASSFEAIMYKLRQKGLLLRKDRKMILQPVFRRLDFASPITIQITLDDE